jgi:2-dehydro-3-deoxyphosphogluconate aldolase/(4S)-4-hydroxy-2-oxoglutarate aldolase
MDGRFDWDLYRELPVVGILRGFSDAAVRRAVGAAVRAGLRNIEITMNSAGAAGQIELLRSDLGWAMNVGAGTVVTLDDLSRALDAGAEFIVTPVVNEAVIHASVDAGVPVIPGGFSPTEIWAAWSAGASVVKLFPAHRFGPSYLHDVCGPFDDIRLMPVGGITPDNVRDYIEAGADGFGVGSTLFNRDRVAADDQPWIARQVALYKRAFRDARR